MGRASSTLKRKNDKEETPSSSQSHNSKVDSPSSSGQHQNNNLNRSYNSKGGNKDSSNTGNSLKHQQQRNKGFYIERRRVLTKKPLQSFMQDGAEGLYIWFLSTWMRMRNKHFNSTTTATTNNKDNINTTITTTLFIEEDEDDLFNSAGNYNTWRESTFSTTTTIFDLDIDDDGDHIDSDVIRLDSDDISVTS